MYTQVDILQCRGRAALRWKAEKGDCYWEGSRSKRYSLQFRETCPEELQIKNVYIYFWRAEKNVDQAPLIFKKKQVAYWRKIACMLLDLSFLVCQKPVTIFKQTSQEHWILSQRRSSPKGWIWVSARVPGWLTLQENESISHLWKRKIIDTKVCWEGNR